MPVRGTPSGLREAIAFAPGHVTGFFSPDLSARDPRGRGSVGAGVVVEVGVHVIARWRPSTRPTLRMRADVPGPLAISREVAERLLSQRTGALEVRFHHDLPVGYGFGTSASGALATALAVGRVLGLPRATSVTTAHLADLFGGGGLGGVASILGGGLEIRRRPGIPPWGAIDHRPFGRPIVLVRAGRSLPSPALLRSEAFLARVREAAREPLRAMARSPTPDTFLREAERFTDGLGLATPSVTRTIDAVRATGARASQAMFGQSLLVVAPDDDARRKALRVLMRRGLAGIEVRAASGGASAESRGRRGPSRPVQRR